MVWCPDPRRKRLLKMPDYGFCIVLGEGIKKGYVFVTGFY